MLDVELVPWRPAALLLRNFAHHATLLAAGQPPGVDHGRLAWCRSGGPGASAGPYPGMTAAGTQRWLPQCGVWHLAVNVGLSTGWFELIASAGSPGGCAPGGASSGDAAGTEQQQKVSAGQPAILLTAPRADRASRPALWHFFSRQRARASLAFRACARRCASSRGQLLTYPAAPVRHVLLHELYVLFEVVRRRDKWLSIFVIV